MQDLGENEAGMYGFDYYGSGGFALLELEGKTEGVALPSKASTFREVGLRWRRRVYDIAHNFPLESDTDFHDSHTWYRVNRG
jgi:hypothetical protein